MASTPGHARAARCAGRRDRGAGRPRYHVTVQAPTGTIVANRYLMGEELGRGGMGAVYRATDLRTGGAVAIKVLHAVFAGSGEFAERLQREAQLAASLTSP